MAAVQPYWKSLWGARAQNNETTEWIRRKERRKISMKDWGPLQIMEISSFSSKTHKCKSPGNDQTQNYWLMAFSAAQRHITKNFNAIMEELEKVPDRLTTGITYLLLKS